MTRRTALAISLACGLAGSAAATVAAAPGLADPTRPPPSVDKPAESGEEKPVASGLQTIVRRYGAKPAAVINGEYVVLGGRVGDARLVRIGEDSVTLSGAGGTEVLKLAPGVDKVPARASPGEVRE